MVGFGLSSAAKPVSISNFTAERSFALTASADEQRYSAASCPQTRIFRRWHGSGAAVRRLSAGAESGLTGCTQKCINSGAKPAYCAAKHINHSSDQRSNEAPATNDAVVPRARR